MSRLTDLLKDLGADADLEREFENNPDSVMDRYGLSGEEKDAVKAQDFDRLKEMSGKSDLSLTNTTIKSYD